MNIKSFSFILLLFLFVNDVSAQQTAAPPSSDSKSGYVAVSLGSAMPVGTYGYKILSNPYSGFASSGLSFTANLQAGFPNSSLGGAVMITHFSNQVDQVAMQQQLQENYPNYQTNAIATEWSCTSVLLGLCTHTSSGKLDVNFRFLIGFAFAVCPDVDITLIDNRYNFNSSSHQSSASATAIAYGGGLNLVFHISQNVGINASADFLATNPDFNVSVTGYGAAASGPAQQNMHIINISAGPAFLF